MTSTFPLEAGMTEYFPLKAGMTEYFPLKAGMTSSYIGKIERRLHVLFSEKVLPAVT
jgi:hypothetical protein